MSDDYNDSTPTDEAVRTVAEKGSATLDRMQTMIDLARAMLVSGEVAEPAGGGDPDRFRYRWESTEAAPGAPRRIWRATADDFATGEGLTVHYAAGLARDEDEFRRQIAREFGLAFADSAKLGEGLDSELQFEGLFLSDNLRAALAKYDRGENPPPAMSFFARYYTNYS